MCARAHEPKGRSSRRYLCLAPASFSQGQPHTAEHGVSTLSSGSKGQAAGHVATEGWAQDAQGQAPTDTRRIGKSSVPIRRPQQARLRECTVYVADPGSESGSHGAFQKRRLFISPSTWMWRGQTVVERITCKDLGEVRELRQAGNLARPAPPDRVPNASSFGGARIGRPVVHHP